MDHLEMLHHTAYFVGLQTTDEVPAQQTALISKGLQLRQGLLQAAFTKISLTQINQCANRIGRMPLTDSQQVHASRQMPDKISPAV